MNETLGGTEYQQHHSQSDMLDSTINGVHNMNMIDDTQKKTPKQRISMFFKKDKSRNREEEELYHHHHQQQQQQNNFLVDSSVFLDGHTSVYDHTHYATQNNSSNKSHAEPLYSPPLDHHLSQLNNSSMTTSTIENEHNHINSTKPSSPVAEKGENLERQSSVRSSTGLPLTPTPSQQQQQTTQQQQQPSTPTPDEDANSRLLAQLKAELARQRYCLENLEIEQQQYKLDARALTDRIDKVHERLHEKQQARQQLENNYNDHLKTLRATDDDLQSVAAKLKELRRMIANLADDLVENVDPKRATGALRNFWINLKKPIEKMGSPLPLNRIRMLTEKYMMDYLIPNLTPNYFPGLAVMREYGNLEYWLRNHNRYTCIRLRQEIAKCIMNDAQRLLAKEIKSKARGLYANLNEAYPYMQQYDINESDPEKTYEAKVRKLVEYSIALGFAMKGQEVDIVATVVQEGAQLFNPVTMEEEEGLSEGTIEFCICPPFIVFDTQQSVLEKGRVFCVAPPRRT